MFSGAVAGQVDENQIFRAAAFGQGQGRATQVFPGGHWSVAKVIAMVHQTDLAEGAEAAGEHVGDVVGFAQEHALLAVAAEGQGVQLNRRGRGGHVAQCLFEQAALGQQAEFEGVGQQLAIGITHTLAIDPGAAEHGTVGQHQSAASRIRVAVELTNVETAVCKVQATLATEAPVVEVTDVMAAVGTDQLALAIERTFLELPQPDIAVSVFVAALAV
ncbi:hypothetical protein D3C72_1079790 [compost metagenome]